MSKKFVLFSTRQEQGKELVAKLSYFVTTVPIKILLTKKLRTDLTSENAFYYLMEIFCLPSPV
jgi:hypothetical protein